MLRFIILFSLTSCQLSSFKAPEERLPTQELYTALCDSRGYGPLSEHLKPLERAEKQLQKLGLPARSKAIVDSLIRFLQDKQKDEWVSTLVFRNASLIWQINPSTIVKPALDHLGSKNVAEQQAAFHVLEYAGSLRVDGGVGIGRRPTFPELVSYFRSVQDDSPEMLVKYMFEIDGEAAYNTIMMGRWERMPREDWKTLYTNVAEVLSYSSRSTDLRKASPETDDFKARFKTVAANSEWRARMLAVSIAYAMKERMDPGKMEELVDQTNLRNDENGIVKNFVNARFPKRTQTE